MSWHFIEHFDWTFLYGTCTYGIGMVDFTGKSRRLIKLKNYGSHAYTTGSLDYNNIPRLFPSLRSGSHA